MGKTSLIRKFVGADESSAETVGIELYHRVMNIDDRKVKLHIWDTTGRAEYRPVLRRCLASCASVLLLYDIMRQETFDHVHDWLGEFRAAQGGNLSRSVVVVVAAKSDCEEYREVSYRSGMSLAIRMNAAFFEVSVRTGAGLQEAFTHVARFTASCLNGGRLPAVPVRLVNSIDPFRSSSRLLPKSRRLSRVSSTGLMGNEKDDTQGARTMASSISPRKPLIDTKEEGGSGDLSVMPTTPASGFCGKLAKELYDASMSGERLLAAARHIILDETGDDDDSPESTPRDAGEGLLILSNLSDAISSAGEAEEETANLTEDVNTMKRKMDEAVERGVTTFEGSGEWPQTLQAERKSLASSVVTAVGRLADIRESLSRQRLLIDELCRTCHEIDADSSPPSWSDLSATLNTLLSYQSSSRPLISRVKTLQRQYLFHSRKCVEIGNALYDGLLAIPDLPEGIQDTETVVYRALSAVPWSAARLETLENRTKELTTCLADLQEFGGLVRPRATFDVSKELRALQSLYQDAVKRNTGRKGGSGGQSLADTAAEPDEATNRLAASTTKLLSLVNVRTLSYGGLLKDERLVKAVGVLRDNKMPVGPPASWIVGSEALLSSVSRRQTSRPSIGEVSLWSL